MPTFMPKKSFKTSYASAIHQFLFCGNMICRKGVIFLKSYDEKFELNKEEKEHAVMCYFNCDKTMAKTIIESSEINGKIKDILRLTQMSRGFGENNG